MLFAFDSISQYMVLWRTARSCQINVVQSLIRASYRHWGLSLELL